MSALISFFWLLTKRYLWNASWENCSYADMTFAGWFTYKTLFNLYVKSVSALLDYIFYYIYLFLDPQFHALAVKWHYIYIYQKWTPFLQCLKQHSYTHDTLLRSLHTLAKRFHFILGFQVSFSVFPINFDIFFLNIIVTNKSIDTLLIFTWLFQPVPTHHKQVLHL